MHPCSQYLKTWLFRRGSFVSLWGASSDDDGDGDELLLRRIIGRHSYHTPPKKVHANLLYRRSRPPPDLPLQNPLPIYAHPSIGGYLLPTNHTKPLIFIRSGAAHGAAPRRSL